MGTELIRAPLKIQEIDGTPSGFPRTLKVTNGTLVDNGDGSFTLTIAGGGGGDVTKVGTPANSEIGVWTGDGTLGKDDDQNANATFTFDGADMIFYLASNDGNPEIRMGGADADELHIQTVYDTGAQTLDYVEFKTDSTTNGTFRFNVAGTHSVTINGSGILPSADQTYDCGEAGTAWNNVFISADGTLDFSNGNATITHDSITDYLMFSGTIQLDGAVLPGTDATYDLGESGTAWNYIYVGTNAQIDWGNGDVVFGHTSGYVEVTTGDLRVTTAGTNAASVVTVGGTQTLTFKTLSQAVVSNDLVFQEAADHTSTPSAGTGILWVKNTTPCTLIFTDDAGTDTTLGSGGGLSADSVEAQHLADSSLKSGAKVNYSLAASVAASALTVTLNASDGSAPASDDPVLLAFRSATLATGTETVRSVTSALTATFSSGSTAGVTANESFVLWVVAFDDGGTIRLGLVNRDHAYQLGEDIVHDGTSEGGAGAADSAKVIYTNAAVTDKPIKILGYIEWDGGLSTPGTWTAPDKIQLFHEGVPRPGSVVKPVVSSNTTEYNTTTSIPYDTSVPQNTEGQEIFDEAIVPSCSANKLNIECIGKCSLNTAGYITLAIFQDSTASSIAANATYVVGNGQDQCLGVSHSMIAETTSSTSIKARYGPSTGTGYWNRNPTANILGGAQTTTFKITEYQA